MDIQKHIAHWRAGAEEDFEVARELVGNGRLRHGLFFLHLALEKMLKAHVAKETREVPPKIHNLIRLAELADLAPSDAQAALLRELNLYQLEGRYPEAGFPEVGQATAEADIANAKELLEWLKGKL